MLKRWGAILLGLGSMAAAACISGRSSHDEQGLCERYTEKLRECGMAALADHPAFTCREPTDAAERCDSECLVNAECDVLRNAFCTPSAQGPIAACRQQCVPPPFRCASGGELIDPRSKCDGEQDCTDGSDEPDTCPKFTCKNGELVAESAICNGFSDCSDSSDEPATCPGFQCGTQRLPESARCDGYADCPDARDELDGCPTFDCGDGQTVQKQDRCDGFNSCTNGADENDCPPDPFSVICG